MNDLVAEAIENYWGSRCADYDPTCPICKAWASYDSLITQNEKMLEALDDIYFEGSNVLDGEWAISVQLETVTEIARDTLREIHGG